MNTTLLRLATGGAVTAAAVLGAAGVAHADPSVPTPVAFHEDGTNLVWDRPADLSGPVTYRLYAGIDAAHLSLGAIWTIDRDEPVWDLIFSDYDYSTAAFAVSTVVGGVESDLSIVGPQAVVDPVIQDPTTAPTTTTGDAGVITYATVRHASQPAPVVHVPLAPKVAPK